MKGLNRSTLLSLFLGVVVSLLPLQALPYIGENADKWDYAQPYADKCFDGQGQVDADACMHDTLSKYDHQMNILYQSLVSALAEDKMLRESQRAWLKFRDLECALRASGMDENGSGSWFLVESCRLDLTLKRIKDLKHLDAGSYCNGCPVRK